LQITQVQRLCRGYLARQRFKEKQKKIILAQSMVRSFLARRLYKKLRAEARTISHIQKMYKGLENKIIELQQKIDHLNRENGSLKIQTAEVVDLK
jgi:myosin V